MTKKEWSHQVMDVYFVQLELLDKNQNNNIFSNYNINNTEVAVGFLGNITVNLDVYSTTKLIT